MGLEKLWNNDVSQATLNPQPVFPELYYPLWWYSGSATSSQLNNGMPYVQKGISGCTATVGTAGNLFTYPSSWPPNLTFALEATIWVTAHTGYVYLWDITAGTIGSLLLQTTSTTATVMRSSNFTLTQGHSYALYLSLSTGGSGSPYIELTDASLIIFPSASLTSLSVSSISLANPSGNALKEAYMPLWMHSSSTITTSQTSQASSFLSKGNSVTQPPNSIYNLPLITLSPNWKPNQKFVLEVSMSQLTNGYVAYAQLCDVSGTAENFSVSGAIVSTSSLTATLIRSGSFTLTPGHSYGIYLWNSGNSGEVIISKTHLVALTP